MVPLAVFGILAAFISTGVECGYASASSGSSSNSDGSGQSFTATNNNGQGTYHHTQNKPGGGGSTTQTGGFPGNNQQGPFYGPANFGQPGFGSNYGPVGFPYGPYSINQQPVFTPYPQNFGFNTPFQPFQPLQPIQPFAPLQPLQPSLATPQEFNQYLNSLSQQYAAYFKQQQELLNTWKNSPFQNGYGGSPNYAYATGAYNPNNGFQQTAGVFPPNKNKPNVDTRFDASENSAGNVPPSGYFGIQTSSFSSSSDVNGVKKHKEAASTTINDNGKVTTYNVEN